MTEILIIEDDNDINSLIAEALKKAGYECVQSYSGTEGLFYAQSRPFSLIITDLMLPGLSGEELLPKLKEKHNVPVIVVSAKDSLDSKVNLLQLGAEDYITKPFELPELLARVAVQLRRFSSSESKPLSYKGLTLKPEAFTADIAGNEISLTRQEFKILELLISHPGRVFSKQDIYDYAWDDVYIGEDKTINVHISNIRKKLKQYTDTGYIDTVWGIGFRLAKQL